MESLSQAMNNLESSLTDFCSNFLRDPPTLKQKGTVANQLRKLDDRLSGILSKLRCASNTIAPPNKLPPELLRAIFSYLRPGALIDSKEETPYEDLLTVGRVCRHWREIAVSATELWTHIILVGRDLSEEEMHIARLCVRRSGVRPLDFYCNPYSTLHPLNIAELIPDRRRLRSVVYLRVDRASWDELASFLLPALYLERLEIRGWGGFPLPFPLSNSAPPSLRELVISGFPPWSNDQLGSLTSLNLLNQKDTYPNTYALLNALRYSPRLEELLLQSEGNASPSGQPPEHNIPVIPLHSLKRLHICHWSAGTASRLLGALDLLPNGISLRFTNVPGDPSVIFPETITPELLPRAATKLELIYPSKNGVILHTTNGAAHTRFVYKFYMGNFVFPPRQLCEEYSPKELWLHINRDNHYEVPPPQALRNLETLVVETHPNENRVLLPMLSPDKAGVPSPLLSTLELWGVPDVATLGKVLKARSDAGFRLKALRIMWSYGCEARMAPLAQFVDKVEFYHVIGNTSRGLELPRECVTGVGRWEPWSRKFVGEMECRWDWSNRTPWNG